MQYQEESDFADASENVDETHMGFLFYGGAEFALVRYLAVAVEGQYRVVSDAIGEGGVSALYGDTSLGGASLVLRVVVASDILERRPASPPKRTPAPTAPARPTPPAPAPTPSPTPTAPPRPVPPPVAPAPSPAPPPAPAGDVMPAVPINEAPPAWLPGHVAPQPPYEAEVEVWIDAAGAVGQVKILRSTNRQYDYQVRLAAMNWR
ncbi:MAG: hypothetical protein H6Q85_449, partial [candidate division NC10 bacterium]|nr:hypothetical protein [candidate division NC10 bacterium]